MKKFNRSDVKDFVFDNIYKMYESETRSNKLLVRNPKEKYILSALRDYIKNAYVTKVHQKYKYENLGGYDKKFNIPEKSKQRITSSFSKDLRYLHILNSILRGRSYKTIEGKNPNEMCKNGSKNPINELELFLYFQYKLMENFFITTRERDDFIISQHNYNEELNIFDETLSTH